MKINKIYMVVFAVLMSSIVFFSGIYCANAIVFAQSEDKTEIINEEFSFGKSLIGENRPNGISGKAGKGYSL